MATLKKRLKEQCEDSVVRYREILNRLEWVPRGILLSEGLAFCAIAELFKVDSIIESGIYNGRSTQIWAEYFSRSHIISIDQTLRQEAIDRLRPYDNIGFVQGNSLFTVPEQIELLNKVGRIAVFIDGPKGLQALSLALKCLEFESVAFVGIHDMKNAEEARAVMMEWKRPLFFTDEKWFVDAYSWLDKNESRWYLEKGTRWEPYRILFNDNAPPLELGSYGPTIGFVINE